MREKAKQKAAEIKEVRDLLSSNETRFLSLLSDRKDRETYLIASAPIVQGVNIIGEKDGQYEHGLATDLLVLYKLLQRHFPKDSAAIKIQGLCKTLFFSFMGYRLEDQHKAPDMVKFFTGESADDVLKQALARLGKPRQKIRIAEEALQPKWVHFVLALLIVSVTWFILDATYSYYYVTEYHRAVGASERYVFGVGVWLTLLLGTLGLEGYYQLFTNLGIRLKHAYRFLSKTIRLYSWRFVWKCFQVPSAIKFHIQNNKKLGFVLLIIVYYVALIYLMR